MNSQPMPAFHHSPTCSPSHPSCPTDSLDNPINPGPNTNWLPSITNWGTQTSIPTWVLGTGNHTQCSGQPPICNGYPVVHPAMINQIPSSVSITTPTLFPI